MAFPVDKEKVKEQRLKAVLEAGTSLLNPPSSTQDLLDLLDKSKNLMIYMEQSNSEPTKQALLPLRNALKLHELLGTSDVDVEMSVISCICEMMRITAPEPPYNDDVLKEFFHLFVPALARLSQNPTSSSYRKAALILEVAAEVRFCVLMVDLKLEKLIIEMFRLFIKTIKSDHPDTVFKHMETIMTLIIRESDDDDISSELLTSLLDSVRKNNMKTSSASWKLGEKVLKNCAAILRPCIKKAVHSSVISLGDYSDIVTSICENGSTRKEDHICSSGEDVVSQVEDTSIVKNNGLPEGSRRKRGRPKKNKTVLNEDGNINSSSVSKVHFLEAHLQEKSLESLDISVKNEAGDTSYLEAKQGCPIKDDFTNLTGKSERDLSAGKEQASVLAGLDEQLVGKKIKVWWPLDKRFYVGIVCSIDHKKKKHKILYADGEDELLDLKEELWELIGDDVSLDEVHEAVFPEPDDSSYIPPKRKRNRKSESAGEAKTGSSSKRGRPKKPKVQSNGEPGNPVNDGKENGVKSTVVDSKSSTPEAVTVSSGAEGPQTCTVSGSKPTTEDTVISSKAEDPQKSTGTGFKPTTPDSVIMPEEQEADLRKANASSDMPQKKKWNRKPGSVGQAKEGPSLKRGRPPKKPKVDVSSEPNNPVIYLKWKDETSTGNGISSKVATPETVIVSTRAEDPQKSTDSSFKPTTPETAMASKVEDPQKSSGDSSSRPTIAYTIFGPKEREAYHPKTNASSYIAFLTRTQKEKGNRKSGLVGQAKANSSLKRGRPRKNPKVEVDKEPDPVTEEKGNGEKCIGTGSKSASPEITIVSSRAEDTQKCRGTSSKPGTPDTSIVLKEREADLPKAPSMYAKSGSVVQALPCSSSKRGRPKKLKVDDDEEKGMLRSLLVRTPKHVETKIVPSKVEDPQKSTDTPESVIVELNAVHIQV